MFITLRNKVLHMRDERIILYCAIVVSVILLFIYVPRNKVREAVSIFLFKQSITWLFGLTTAHFGLVEYPVNIFHNATKSGFVFDFVAFPVLCVLFNLYYPERKNGFLQFMHYFYYCTAMTLVEVILERYTNVIKYIHWSWYLSWTTLFLTFFVSRRFYLWFFRLKPAKTA